MGLFSDLKEKILNYVDVHIKLLKLNFISRTANVISYIIFSILCMFVIFCVMLFSGFVLAEGLTALGISKFFSFLITFGFFMLVLLILFASRKRIIRMLGNTFVSVLTDDTTDNKEK